MRVNANVLKVDQAIALLDFIWDDARLVERLLNTCLIQEELERSPIELSDAELQLALDEFRISKKLFSAEETHAWLERHGMTHQKLERYVHDSALVARLRDRIAADGVEGTFASMRPTSTARHGRIELLDESRALAVAESPKRGLGLLRRR